MSSYFLPSFAICTSFRLPPGGSREGGEMGDRPPPPHDRKFLFFSFEFCQFCPNRPPPPMKVGDLFFTKESPPRTLQPIAQAQQQQKQWRKPWINSGAYVQIISRHCFESCFTMTKGFCSRFFQTEGKQSYIPDW